MANIDQAMVSKILNSTTSATAFTTPTAPFKVRLDSTASTATTPGTELPNGGGYVTGGQTSTAPFATTSSAGSAVTIPATAALSWPNSSGSSWTIQSLDLFDSAGTPLRYWFGNFNGAPLTIANGNTFQIAVNGISIALA